MTTCRPNNSFRRATCRSCKRSASLRLYAELQLIRPVRRPVGMHGQRVVSRYAAAGGQLHRGAFVASEGELDGPARLDGLMHLGDLAPRKGALHDVALKDQFGIASHRAAVYRRTRLPGIEVFERRAYPGQAEDLRAAVIALIERELIVRILVRAEVRLRARRKRGHGWFPVFRDHIEGDLKVVPGWQIRIFPVRVPPNARRPRQLLVLPDDLVGIEEAI